MAQVISYAKTVKTDIMNDLKKGLKMIGLAAESYAKQLCPVDTGLLRNSITFALGGEGANTKRYETETGEQGEYKGTASQDSEGQLTLYVGTNVHYAPYIELGHHTVKGNWVEPKEFLRPAMEGHEDEYLRILQSACK